MACACDESGLDDGKDRTGAGRIHVSGVDRRRKKGTMTALEIPAELRTTDKFHHIAVGFLNVRLCISALRPEALEHFLEYQRPESDHLTVVANQHLLVTTLLDCCEAVDVPTCLRRSISARRATCSGAPSASRHARKSTTRSG